MLNLSISHGSSFRSQSSCSSSSSRSADSLDQFCRDFGSSVNLASEINSASLHICDNNEGHDLCDSKTNDDHPVCDDCVLSTADNYDEGLLDKAASYEGKTY